MWVKICGNTNLRDALGAVERGADAVGFVFAESRRRVTAAEVRVISAGLPEGVERVGVFDSRDAEEIAEAVNVAGLTAVQLHGGLDEALVERLVEKFGGKVGVIQTLHWLVGEDGAADRLAEELRRVGALGVVERVLIDSKVGSAAGGTGVAFDWAAAGEVFRGGCEGREGMRLIVAGGLRPENVAEAIAALRPWGVDVSSGVEAAVGRKDLERVGRFIARAKSSAESSAETRKSAGARG